jgi:uncharacterized integral membrane protein (TIGR00698 family)
MQIDRLHAHPFQPVTRRLSPLLPGVVLCAVVSVVAMAAENLQVRAFEHAWIGDLVLAIVFGTLVRSFASLPTITQPGIRFSAKTLLEIGVVLLGASLSFAILKEAGVALIGGIAVIVILSLGGSYLIGRALGLSPRLATLIACGNSICGNSAIAAAAPAIGAKADDVAASIAFTAILGVAAVLVMPLLPSMLGLDVTQYGIFAGLTVYAVPQVLAATAPLGAISVQTGTIVKLIRVLMLGPVVALLSVIHGRSGNGRMDLRQMVPWFILGFTLMVMFRSLGLIPQSFVAPLSTVSNILTIMAMAALGLSVDVRSLRHAGGKVICAASLSLVLLGIMSIVLISLIL